MTDRERLHVLIGLKLGEIERVIHQSNDKIQRLKNEVRDLRLTESMLILHEEATAHGQSTEAP